MGTAFSRVAPSMLDAIRNNIENEQAASKAAE